MREVTRKAYAKINLALDVTGRRADGYHLVDMVMQTIGLHDTLTMRRGGDGQVRLTLSYPALTAESCPAAGMFCAAGGSGKAEELSCGAGTSGASGGSCGGAFRVSRQALGADTVPDGGDNLVCRAVEALRRAYPGYGMEDGVEVTLEKRIPAAAGMAGGSTDAAAALCAARELFGLPCTDRELEALALPLGADIPYCLTGGTKRAQGIGERLTALPPAPACELVVVKPPFAVSTPWAYREIDRTGVAAHPDMEAVTAAIVQGDGAALWAAAGNVLEPAVRGAHPQIGALEEFLLARGARRAMMTGSGPTVFAVFDGTQAAETADRAYAALCGEEAYRDCAVFRTAFWP